MARRKFNSMTHSVCISQAPTIYQMGFPGGAVIKNLPASAEDAICRVQSLSWEDPLEKEMVTHSSILAWRNPWTEKSVGLQSMGSQ